LTSTPRKPLRAEAARDEAQRSAAALRIALEQIAAHDGERYLYGVNGTPEQPQDTPQEIAAAALAAGTETP
jgi:hypothetical protein